MLVKIADNNLIDGLGPSVSGIKIKYLQYTDDTILFYRVDKIDINTLKIILYTIELLIGLKINFSKISIIGLGLLMETTEAFAKMLGCSAA